MNFKLILLIIWMSIIFIFSNQPAKESSDLSNSFINKTIIKIYEIKNGTISTEEKEKIIKKYSYKVRKFAHFSEYFILGLLTFLYLKDKNKKVFIYSLLFCFLYACSDEFHQLFIQGRYSSFFDVLIDTSGALFSIIILKILFTNKRKLCIINKVQRNEEI